MSNEVIKLLEELKIQDDFEMNDIDQEISKNYEKNNLSNKFINLFNDIRNIIHKEPKFIAEIVDNIIIIENTLYGINLQLDDNNKFLPDMAILHLPKGYKEKIPRKNDINLWEEKFDHFDELRVHLRNDSVDESNNFIDFNDNFADKVIELASLIIQKEYENKKKVEYNTELTEMYKIASYLEHYYYHNNIGSFYSENQLDNNDYFIKFKGPVLERFRKTLFFMFNKEQFEVIVIDALLKVLRGSQNMLILFGPFGFNALSKNNNKSIIGNLTLQSIFEFKREALRFFALNHLIDLKLYNKKIHLNNPNDYVNFIFDGSVLIN